MPGGENETNFFMIDSATATTANHFPVNDVAGCLMVMNLYNTHIIQRYYAITGKVYERIITRYTSGGSWTAWEEK